jgi:hypothetical protein
MAYMKVKMKSNGNKASPCFKPFPMENASYRSLPVQALIQVSFKHILLAYMISKAYQSQ